MADGIGYSRLVPASLLPPEDPAFRGSARTVRDWFVDVVFFLLAAGLGIVVFFATYAARTGAVADWVLLLDITLGVVAVASLWWRRRWPVGVAVLTAVVSIVSGAAQIAGILALFSVAVHRRTVVALLLGAVNLGAAALFELIRPQDTAFWVAAVAGLAISAVVVAWGMFVRARRQLVWTLRERAERAETEQRMLAEQARLAERTRIAREMHDVLAHRISLLALHAGGLQVRPDLPADEVRETAGLLRSTAQRALEELRSVIGVLRDGDPDTATAPQPTLRDVPRLVQETQRAGARIDFELDVPAGAEVPDALGRDAYRIVQEALTNVAKHATGTATRVRVRGGPGHGCTWTCVTGCRSLRRPHCRVPAVGWSGSRNVSRSRAARCGTVRTLQATSWSMRRWSGRDERRSRKRTMSIGLLSAHVLQRRSGCCWWTTMPWSGPA